MIQGQFGLQSDRQSMIWWTDAWLDYICSVSLCFCVCVCHPPVSASINVCQLCGRAAFLCLVWGAVCAAELLHFHLFDFCRTFSLWVSLTLVSCHFLPPKSITKKKQMNNLPVHYKQVTSNHNLLFDCSTFPSSVCLLIFFIEQRNLPHIHTYI